MSAQPCYLLAPVAARYRPGEALVTVGGFELHALPPEYLRQGKMRCYAWPARPVNARLAAAPIVDLSIDALVFEQQRFERRERLTPSGRRLRARRFTHGRRGAKPVPMATIYAAAMFVLPETTPQIVGQAMTAERLGIVRQVWRCAGWRRGAPIWIVGKDR